MAAINLGQFRKYVTISKLEHGMNMIFECIHTLWQMRNSMEPFLVTYPTMHT